MLPFAFAGILLTSLQRMCMVALVWVFVSASNTFATLLWDAFYEHSRMRGRPMKGILQIIHGVFIALGCIITVSILINRSPTALITGLGAFAAILLLIFKDTILGFVAGIQLAQYDMVRNDDWITIPGTIVDGVVSDVSLNTVKVRNYDNTLIMLPPYTLVSQPIQNWRGMKESGGRRIMQSVVVDLNSIQFCTPELIKRLSTHSFITDFINHNGIITYDPMSDTTAHEALDNKHVGTNLALFRQYLTNYLTRHPDIQHQETYTLMVRTLQPDGNGIPLQIYCFTNTTHWESYEIIQSQIMEYTIAMMPLFELYPFQNASARDYIAQSLVSQGYKPEDIGATGI
jgi:miniconductance mechanosensitive channel